MFNGVFGVLSHPFIARLIGTIRREYLERTLFQTTDDLEARYPVLEITTMGTGLMRGWTDACQNRPVTVLLQH